MTREEAYPLLNWKGAQKRHLGTVSPENALYCRHQQQPLTHQYSHHTTVTPRTVTFLTLMKKAQRSAADAPWLKLLLVKSTNALH